MKYLKTGGSFLCLINAKAKEKTTYAIYPHIDYDCMETLLKTTREMIEIIF